MRFGQENTAFDLHTVVIEIHDRCAQIPAEKLNVEVDEPASNFSLEIDCAAAVADAYTGVQQPLVKAAATHRDAGKRADRAITLQDSLPPTDGLAYDRDQLIWGFAASNGMACARAQSPKQIQQGMAESAQAGLETAEHWTLIEAVFLEGACPDKLPDLYRNVAALGNPTAANTVKELVARKPVSVPLKSIPDGVSTRSIDGRPVFLERHGDDVTTFIADPHHLPDGREMWWCSNEKLFVAPKYGDFFNADGSAAGGPPPRGLDRFKTTVKGDTATVHLQDLVRGSTTRHPLDQTMFETPIPAENSWDTNPGSFCFGAIKSRPAQLGS
jgi:hypothetical protein